MTPSLFQCRYPGGPGCENATPDDPCCGRRIPASTFPDRVVVGANGAYWRDYGDHYSMCPVSTDNDPVEPIAVYVPAPKGRCARCGEDTWLTRTPPNAVCAPCNAELLRV